MSQLLRESSPGPGERGYAPVLLDVIIGAVRYKVRSKSDLVEALEKRESQPVSNMIPLRLIQILISLSLKETPTVIVYVLFNWTLLFFITDNCHQLLK